MVPLPRLIFLSPVVLDQSFPRSDEDLRIARLSLAELNDRSLQGSIILGLTELLQDIAAEYDASRFANEDARDVYTLLLRICSAPHVGVIRIAANDVNDSHPVPVESMPVEGNTDLWASEMANLAAIHSTCGDHDITCAGIASARAFANLPCKGYDADDRGTKKFVLVGPEDITRLKECKRYVSIPGRVSIAVRDIEAHYQSIGGRRVEEGGEHPAVHFEDGKKWPFDRKWKNNVPDLALAELVQITGFSLAVIKRALKLGIEPQLEWMPCLCNSVAN